MCDAYAVGQGMTDLLITVNPCHREFYPKIFGMEKFSTEKSCPSVQNAPALGYRLDLRKVVQERAKWFSEGPTLPALPAGAPPFSPEDENYFQSLLIHGPSASAHGIVKTGLPMPPPRYDGLQRF